jgi:mono/diheme cytochrome c family protein
MADSATRPPGSPRQTDLAPGAIQAIVRNGIGSMPPLRKTELSDADVEAIAAYLTRRSR